MLSILNRHAQEKHKEHLMEETYLQRLWTLQECLLSHRIRFVTNKQGKLTQTSTFDNFNNFSGTESKTNQNLPPLRTWRIISGHPNNI
jgi:hypothetical protein